MAALTPYTEIVVGLNILGNSQYGTVSVMSLGTTAGVVGIIVAGTFYPHPNGSVAAGGMLTFECGQGRLVGFNATVGGLLSIASV